MKTKFLFLLIFITAVSFGQSTVHHDITNFGFTDGILTDATDQVDIMVDSKILATESHVYYIGANDGRIYDLARDGNTWESYPSPLLGNQTPLLSGTQIVNNGDKLYYVGTDELIYEMKYIDGPGWIETLLVPSMDKVRPGTDIIFYQDHIFYVNQQHKICDLVYDYDAANWTGGEQLSKPGIGFIGQAEDVKVNTQILANSIHVFFIGESSDNIYEIVWDDNINRWINGNWPLDPNAPTVLAGTQLTNDENHIYYISSVNNELAELFYTTGPGWVGQLLPNGGIEPIIPESGLVYFDNHLYYVSGNTSQVTGLENDLGTWNGGILNSNAPIVKEGSELFVWNNPIFEEGEKTQTFNSHHVFYVDEYDRINFLVWDDIITDFDAPCCNDEKDKHPPNGNLTGYDDPSSNGSTIFGNCNYHCDEHFREKEWHSGHLLGTLNEARTDIKITNWTKQLYYAGTDSRVHRFHRSPNNENYYKGWLQIFDQEFDDGTILDPIWATEFTWGNHPTIVEDNTLNRNFCYDYWNNPENVTVADDLLSITANLKYNTADNNRQNWNGCSRIYETSRHYMYNTGMVGTDQELCPQGNGFSFLFGFAEIRCKTPRGRSFWPGFWLKGHGAQDLNLFEGDGNGKKFLTTQFVPDNQGSYEHVKTYAVGYRFYDDFYTYSVLWNDDFVEYYLNNELLCTMIRPAINDPDYYLYTPHWLYVTLEIHPDVAGVCEYDVFEDPDIAFEDRKARFDIDYVRVFEDPNPPYRIKKPEKVETIISVENTQDLITLNQSNIHYLVLIDISGKQVLKANGNTLSTSGLNKGIYLLTVYKSDNTHELIKLVKM